ncbi:hypothetical protein BDA99DRAFT_443797 [Phascolomyces articulosus]|uniref:Uncharacterized protein n=1 Tax=Phascolomyces articulosus TaxID=60185 RepID=A0AAD5JTB6_9FUNG|nr:hypothetical protein BDA99DRAFT_443797 [Phascolomyces articulosus]
MEPFLSTLPPYVHDFLNRHPPTDVFNVLRELICFAVLYSNDREKILTLSKELINKGAADGASMSEKIPIAAKEETRTVGTATPVSSTSSSIRSANDTPPPTTKQGVPYTFPEWWGHHDEPESLRMLF